MFAGLPFSVDWSTSMIAKRESGKTLRSGVDGVALREPDADDEIEAVPRQRSVVGDVIRRRPRLGDADLDAELLLRPLEPFVRQLVETAVVQLSDVGDEPDLELRVGRLGGAGARPFVIAAAGRKEEHDPGCHNDRAEVFA